MKYFKKIEGKRLYLSPMNMEDVSLYCKWLNDSLVTDGINKTEKVTTLENERIWLEKSVADDNYQFVIVLKENDTPIGSIAINNIDNLNQKATVGIFIGEINNHNKGYGTEALSLLIGYGFDILNLNNIMLAVFSFNEKAIACYKKVGFKEIGRRRNCKYIRNIRYDEIFMDIIRDEYYANKNS